MLVGIHKCVMSECLKDDIIIYTSSHKGMFIMHLLLNLGDDIYII